MEQRYRWDWVGAEAERTAATWNACAERTLPPAPRHTPKEQSEREAAYDRGLRAVEREARRAPRTRAERLQAQRRIVEVFPGFAATALGLDADQVHLLTDGFLPVGTQLARWARNFDATLTVPDIVQACRNAWTACGLQALLGKPMELTPAILAYSLLYPYSDNDLDRTDLSCIHKLRSSQRFRRRLAGLTPSAIDAREAAVWAMVQMIEEQYPRALYPQVFDCLLAIHRAQEESISQLERGLRGSESLSDLDLLRITCAKGGTSVLANACLIQPRLTAEESRFAMDWGVLLQLGDDLQDVREDLRRGSATLFTREAAMGKPLDRLVVQLLNLSRLVADRMDRLAYGTPSLKNLLRMSWRSLILMAVADLQPFLSPALLAELEPHSPFRFNFLRARNRKLAGRQAFYAILFDAFIEAGADQPGSLPAPGRYHPETALLPGPELATLSNSFA
jgi:hypothetical protein